MNTYLPSTAPPSFAKVKSCTYVHNNFALCQKFKKSLQLLFIKRLFFEKNEQNLSKYILSREKKTSIKSIFLTLFFVTKLALVLYPIQATGQDVSYGRFWEIYLSISVQTDFLLFTPTLQTKNAHPTVKSLTSEAIPSATQFFKRAYKISHFPGL